MHWLIGAVCGAFNGLLGSGGGAIAVFSFDKFLKLEKKKSHATSIAVMLPLSIISAFVYLRGGIEWLSIILITCGGLVGGFIGANRLKNISIPWLGRIFGAVMIFAALRSITSVMTTATATATETAATMQSPIGLAIGAGMTGLGILAGTLSGMGIGGGAILIPALTMFFGISQHNAQSANLIYFIPTAAIALITHAKQKRIEKQILPKIMIAGCITAICGAMLAVRLNANVLRLIFGVFLLIMGIVEIKKSFGAKKAKQETEKSKG